MPFGIGHEIICLISRGALWSFYADIQLQDEENAVVDGPLIVAATHHNMAVDPAILSVTFPHERRLHYWAKDTMFRHPLVRRFLLNCGALPVDRKGKNNAALYAETYKVLRLGEAIAVFPEGTSHTLPHLGAFKDGVSYAALEYAKSIQDDPHPNSDGTLPRPAAVLPVGIVYPEKSKYRSMTIVKYGKPIKVDRYMETYAIDPKRGAKMLTADLTRAVEQLTVNAPDWETRDAAEMARWLLFPRENGLMRDYILVTQSLIKVFDDLASKDGEIAMLKESLRAYKMELEALQLKDSHIARYNEKEINAWSTTMELVRRTLVCVMDLPLFLPGLVGHFPLYIAGYYYADKFEIYEEVRAQNKIMLGLVLLPFVYLAAFVWGWTALFGRTFFGFFEALATLGIFVWYHVVSIDERYENFKDLVGRWRLFDAVVLGRGMWRRKERILQLKYLRDQNLDGVRQMIKTYKGSQDDVHTIWMAIRSRVRKFGDASRLHGRARKLAKQYEWSFDG
ncbi:hypothetical protein BX666DRAFT_2018683 [Dichotomocladium elegans]|nr:hypothetical protein BX666DRAFT_2018683 [Dichotomocladium elegans]